MADAGDTVRRIYDPRITLGNVIQIVMLAAAVAGIYVTIVREQTQLRADINTVLRDQERHEQRINAYEGARDDMSGRLIRVEILQQQTADTVRKIADAVGAK